MADPGTTILSLSTSPWDYPYWTSRQFLMYRLSALAKVIYVSGRSDLSEALHWKLPLRRAAAPFPAPANLDVLSPLWPKMYRFAAVEGWLLDRYVHRLQRHLDAGRPARRVVYAWHPDVLDTVRLLDYDVLIYHPYDMFRHFEGAGSHIVAREEAMCGLADAVVTPHTRVGSLLGHPSTHVMNNGLFLAAFPDDVADRALEQRERRDHPVVGYVGAINPKLDFRLLHEVFRERPDWQLVMIGPSGGGPWRESAEYRALAGLPNTEFGDGVPIDRVAHVMMRFDVGIIPYSLSSWARYSESPLKLYQYWAMGLPVVSSPLPTLVSEPGALEVCETGADWQRGIEAQLGAPPANSRVLRDRAVAHSWQSKAEQVFDVIGSL